MTTQTENHVKILFNFYNDVLEEQTVETMWAVVVDKEKGLYKLDSIPFYAPLVASGDIVFAEYNEEEQMLTYKSTFQHSGNSTIQVTIMNDGKGIQEIRDLFKALGCVSEGVNDKYFAMEIPAGVDYKIIKQKLDELEKGEIIGYAEPCLGEGHRY